MVLRSQAGLARFAPHRRDDEAPYKRPSYAALEELNALDEYTNCHADAAPLQRKHPYSLPSNRRNKFKSEIGRANNKVGIPRYARNDNSWLKYARQRRHTFHYPFL